MDMHTGHAHGHGHGPSAGGSPSLFHLYLTNLCVELARPTRTDSMTGDSARASGESSRPRAFQLLKDLPRHPNAPTEGNSARLIPDSAKTLFIATYERTQPPASQIVTTERQNILLRQFQQRAETKRQHKRAAAAAAESGDEPKAKQRREGSDGGAPS